MLVLKAGRGVSAFFRSKIQFFEKHFLWRRPNCFCHVDSFDKKYEAWVQVFLPPFTPFISTGEVDNNALVVKFQERNQLIFLGKCINFGLNKLQKTLILIAAVPWCFLPPHFFKTWWKGRRGFQKPNFWNSMGVFSCLIPLVKGSSCRLPFYVFCICQQLNIRNTNQLSWAIN